jgi:hypothetical protein
LVVRSQIPAIDKTFNQSTGFFWKHGYGPSDALIPLVLSLRVKMVVDQLIEGLAYESSSQLRNVDGFELSIHFNMSNDLNNPPRHST